MSDSSYHSNRRSGDRHSRSHHRDYHDHDRHDRYSRDHRDPYYDRNDSYRHERSQRRVPGLVTDPDRSADDTDSAIRRGQREAMDRYRSDNYYGNKGDTSSRVGTKTKDTMSPPPYNISSLSKPYIPQSHRTYDNYGTTTRRRVPINAAMLAIFTGLVGFGTLIASIVLVDWIVTVANAVTPTITRMGLFQQCQSSSTAAQVSCSTLEQASADGDTFTELQQATRALIIIAVIFNFGALIVCFIFGTNRWERSRGAYYVGGMFLLAGCCAVAAMGCFSAVLTQRINNTTSIALTMPGTSFHLGWFGTACLILSALEAFLANSTAWKKK